jgi:shikimate kinase
MMIGHNNMRNLVLAGFMGTGKSTVGRLVADQLGLAFVDTDAEIEAQAGCSIADIFAQGGETAFRQIEAEVCLHVASQSGQVLATGGGALLNAHVYETFAANSLIICLTCDLDEIIRRVGVDSTRPLFAAERDRLARLLAERSGLYNRLPYQLDTTYRDPAQVVKEVINLWQQHA